MQAQSVPTPRVRPEDVEWAKARLTPPTRRDFRKAVGAGRDPRSLIERFAREYSAACEEDTRRIDALAGKRGEAGCDEALRDECALYLFHLNVERHAELFAEPAVLLAEVTQPDLTKRDLMRLRRDLRSTSAVVTVTRAPRLRTAGCAPRRTTSHGPHRTVAARRAGGIRSGTDPGDPDPEPASLTLAPPPRAIYTFGVQHADRGKEPVAEIRFRGRPHEVFIADTCNIDGASLWASGRTRISYGPNWKRERYLSPKARTWPLSAISSVRWLAEEVAV